MIRGLSTTDSISFILHQIADSSILSFLDCVCLSGLGLVLLLTLASSQLARLNLIRSRWHTAKTSSNEDSALSTST